MDCEISNDDDYSSISDGDDAEDETTIAEQEAFEETNDHSQEISMLEEEGLSVVCMQLHLHFICLACTCTHMFVHCMYM